MTTGEGFTCPRCGRTSHHPEDKRQGYCGACHAFTGDECAFCAIIRGHTPPTGILANWGDCIALRPLNPVTDGHTLIIPTAHMPDALTDPYITGLVFARAAEYAGFRSDVRDYNLITSVGPLATQTVFHLHVHVVPRRPGDGLTLPWTGQVPA